ncbi:MAG: type III pantothenate kinase [Bacteroidales bacterium]|nr:type III pantothenate kinase [Bacteroidales bacterium]
MKLALDIGNTRTKVALFDRKHLLECVAPEHLEAYICTVCRHHEVTDAVACCVGQEPDWQRLLPAGVRLTLLTPQSPLPFAVDYEGKERLGTDRIAVALGAYHRTGGKGRTVVIDAGTCITLDLLEEGTFRGGAIMPGINMHLQAMHSLTARLPLIDFSNQEAPVVGRSTEECLLSGAATATLFAIEGYLRSLQPQQVLVTGGDGAWLHSHIPLPTTLCPHLLMEGLNLLKIEQ